MKARAHIYLSGKVQGVFFRYATQEQAVARNVTGWVRNLPDGRVEALFEGEKSDVDEMVDFCRRGPSGARVEYVEVEWEDYSGEHKNFRILHRL